MLNPPLPPVLLVARCGYSGVENLFHCRMIMEISFQFDAESINKGEQKPECIKNYQKLSLDVFTDVDISRKQDGRQMR